MSFSVITNRISTAGWQYDSAGNLTRGQAENGVWQRYQYDAANRLVAVMNDSSVVVVANSYGSDNGRLKSVENGITRWYGWDGGQAIVEYSDNRSSLVWVKSYVYLGGRLLLTDEPIIGRQYHHADRLGTRIVTNASGAKLTEQATLPFGTALASPETTGTPTNRRFTSYDRSGATKPICSPATFSFLPFDLILRGANMLYYHPGVASEAVRFPNFQPKRSSPS